MNLQVIILRLAIDVYISCTGAELLSHQVKGHNKCRGAIRSSLLGIENIESGLGSITDLSRISGGPAKSGIVVSTRLGLYKQKEESG